MDSAENDGDSAGVGGKKGARGRPKGKGRTRLELLDPDPEVILPSKRRNVSSCPPQFPSPSRVRNRQGMASPALPPKQDPGSTSSRPSFYLLGRVGTSLSNVKLPKTGPLLGRILSLTESKSLTDAIKEVLSELKSVWLHHFGPKWINGEEGKIIMRDDYIIMKLRALYGGWRKLETESRKPDRAAGKSFLAKQQALIMQLDMPFDIRSRDCEAVMEKSGVKEWKEDVLYLRGQLTKEQPGCPGSWDTRQQKRDERKLREKLREDARVEKEKNKENELKEKRELLEREYQDHDVEIDENDNEASYEGKKEKSVMIDVMGKIAQTCDAKNISAGTRAVLAASVCNAVGVDLSNRG